VCDQDRVDCGMPDAEVISLCFGNRDPRVGSVKLRIKKNALCGPGFKI
jgi:hypothetical protein